MLVKTEPGEVIKPDSVKGIVNEGMPTHKQPFIKGNLFIKFSVEFPESFSLTDEQIRSISSSLPSPPVDQDVVEATSALDSHEFVVEQVSLANIDPSERMRQTGGEAYDSDDEQPGGQRVQCAHQ